MLAHASVLLKLRSLSEGDEEALRNTRIVLTEAYTNKPGLDLMEDGMETRINSEDALDIQCVLKPLLFGATAGLIKHHDRGDNFRKGHAALRTYTEMQQQIAANDELERGKEEEDKMTKAMEDFLENFTNVATDKQINKMKSILKVNTSAGAENHASAWRENGAGRSTRRAGNSNGNSKRGSAGHSHNSSNNQQQRGKQKKNGQNKHGQSKQNKQNSNSRGRSRSRSTSTNRNAGRSSRRRSSRSRSNSRVRFSREDEEKARRDNQSSYGGRSSHRNYDDGSGWQRRGRNNNNNHSQGGGRNRRNEDYDDGCNDWRPQRRPSASSSGYSRRRDRSRSRSRSRSDRNDHGSRGGRSNGGRGGDARRR